MTTIKNTNNIEVDEFGNTVVATDQQVVNRKNISVDKTDVVLEDLCCPCGLCCCIQAWYCNPSGCLGCVLKQECCGCRWSGKCCKCMSPSKNDQKMCCLFQQTACSCHLPTTLCNMSNQCCCVYASMAIPCDFLQSQVPILVSCGICSVYPKVSCCKCKLKQMMNEKWLNRNATKTNVHSEVQVAPNEYNGSPEKLEMER